MDSALARQGASFSGGAGVSARHRRCLRSRGGRRADDAARFGRYRPHSDRDLSFVSSFASHLSLARSRARQV